MMGAMKKDMLLILDIISTAQVTSWGGVVIPGHTLNSLVCARSLKRATLSKPTEEEEK